MIRILIEQHDNYSYFWVDIVKSSDPKISSSIQKQKVEKLKNWIINFFFEKLLIELPENGNNNGIKRYTYNPLLVYKSFLGDGWFFIFKKVAISLELTKYLHQQLRIQAPTDESRISLRIGIGAGGTLNYFNNDLDCIIPRNYKNQYTDYQTPWGENMIQAQRIMSLANPDQILIDENVIKVINSDDIFVDYRKSIISVGKRETKNGEINVCILYKPDEYGNNKKIDETFHIPLVLQTKIKDQKYNDLFTDYWKNEIYDFANNISNVVECGYEITRNSERRLIEMLFEKTSIDTKYYGITILSPYVFMNQNYNFLEAHEKLCENRKKITSNSSNYIFDKRFMSINPEIFYHDFDIDNVTKENYSMAINFLVWHAKEYVDLCLVKPEKIKYIFIDKNNLDTADAGLWKNKCAIEFFKADYEDIARNTIEDTWNNRKILLTFKNQENKDEHNILYYKIEKAFDELNEHVEECRDNVIIDAKYYYELIEKENKDEVEIRNIIKKNIAQRLEKYKKEV